MEDAGFALDGFGIPASGAARLSSPVDQRVGRVPPGQGRRRFGYRPAPWPATLLVADAKYRVQLAVGGAHAQVTPAGGGLAPATRFLAFSPFHPCC